MKTKNSILISSLIAFVNSIILIVRTINDIQNSINLSLSYVLLTAYFLLSIASLYLFVIAFFSFLQDKKKVFKIANKPGINKYLIDYIENGGRTVILSRDLSWINADIIGRIEEKAAKDELIIFLPKENTISRRLSQHADIRYFGDLITDSAHSIIKSRFTIIQWDSNSARITYPKQDHTHHYNYEFSINEPTMDIALDLIRLLIKLIPKTI